MEVNFRQFPVFTGITKENKLNVDISEALANVIYQYEGGAKAQELAKKIYGAKDKVDLEAIEIQIIVDATRFMPGVLADSIKDFFDLKSDNIK